MPTFLPAYSRPRDAPGIYCLLSRLHQARLGRCLFQCQIFLFFLLPSSPPLLNCSFRLAVTLFTRNKVEAGNIVRSRFVEGPFNPDDYVITGDVLYPLNLDRHFARAWKVYARAGFPFRRADNSSAEIVSLLRADRERRRSQIRFTTTRGGYVKPH